MSPLPTSRPKIEMLPKGGVQLLYGTSLSLLGRVYYRIGRLAEAAYLRRGVKLQRESGMMQFFNLMLIYQAEEIFNAQGARYDAAKVEEVLYA
jgi:hypothetical protein